jgi:hypothetical protein
MDGMKVEPNSEEEIRSSDIDIQHIDINQEGPEPMNFIEVKCEVEVSRLFEISEASIEGLMLKFMVLTYADQPPYKGFEQLGMITAWTEMNALYVSGGTRNLME